MSRLVRSSSAPTQTCPPRKRQRRQQQQPVVQRQQQMQRPFLPTHVRLLEALYANDDLEGALMDDKVKNRRAPPLWAKIHSFIDKQGVIADIDKQRQRATAILRTLGGSTTCDRTVGEDDLQRDRPDLRPAAQEAETGMATPTPRPHHVPRSQDFHFSHTQRFRPAAVVSGVLRRAAKDRRIERNAEYAALADLKLAVKRTVDELDSSLGALSRAQNDSCAATWNRRREEDMTAADVIECKGTKLLLWRKLQSSILALDVPTL